MVLTYWYTLEEWITSEVRKALTSRDVFPNRAGGVETADNSQAARIDALLIEAGLLLGTV